MQLLQKFRQASLTIPGEDSSHKGIFDQGELQVSFAKSEQVTLDISQYPRGNGWSMHTSA